MKNDWSLVIWALFLSLSLRHSFGETIDQGHEKMYELCVVRYLLFFARLWNWCLVVWSPLKVSIYNNSFGPMKKQKLTINQIEDKQKEKENNAIWTAFQSLSQTFSDSKHWTYSSDQVFIDTHAILHPIYCIIYVQRQCYMETMMPNIVLRLSSLKLLRYFKLTGTRQQSKQL